MPKDLFGHEYDDNDTDYFREIRNSEISLMKHTWFVFGFLIGTVATLPTFFIINVI